MDSIKTTALASLILIATSLAQAEQAAAPVYQVAWLRGQPDFSLITRGTTPDDMDDAEKERFLRLMAEATCLERPQVLPGELGIMDKAAPEFLSMIVNANERLRRLAAEARPRHTEDPDYEPDPVSRLGWSAALEQELNDRMQQVLLDLGLYRRLQDSYEANRVRPNSCQSKLFAYMLEQRSGREQPIPAEEQWRAMVDICGGAPDDLGDHIVYHMSLTGVDPKRRDAFMKVAYTGGFKACLTGLLARDAELTRRVLAVDGTNSADEIRSLRSRVHQIWQDHGLADAIEEVYRSGSFGEAYEAFRRQCAGLDELDGPD